MTNARLAWMATILAYVPFPRLYWAFRRRLASRRDEYCRLLCDHAPSQSVFEKSSFGLMLGCASEREAESFTIRAKFDAAYSGQNSRVELARHFGLDDHLRPFVPLALRRGCASEACWSGGKVAAEPPATLHLVCGFVASQRAGDLRGVLIAAVTSATDVMEVAGSST